jgi:hypothetical protein
MGLLKRLFAKKFKSYLLDKKYRVIEAFAIKGKKYYMFDSTFEVPAGRMLATLAIMEEMNMRVDREYLEAHAKAMEKILSDPKKISIQWIVQLNINLKERLGLMPLSDAIYKLASVIFFDETESPYSYDFEYNRVKIEEWKQSKESLDFFLSRLSTELIPSLQPATGNVKTYFQVTEKIDAIHRDHLTKVLSENQ